MRPLDDFHQLHDQRRIEEVQVADLGGALGDVGNPGAHDEGAVGRQNGAGRSNLVQIGEDLALEVDALQDGFNNHVRVLDRFLEIAGKRNQAPGLLGVFLRHLPLLHTPRQIAFDEFLGLFQHGGNDIRADGFKSGERALERDLMPHVSSPNDTNIFYIFNLHGLSSLSLSC